MSTLVFVHADPSVVLVIDDERLPEHLLTLLRTGVSLFLQHTVKLDRRPVDELLGAFSLIPDTILQTVEPTDVWLSVLLGELRRIASLPAEDQPDAVNVLERAIEAEMAFNDMTLESALVSLRE